MSASDSSALPMRKRGMLPLRIAICVGGMVVIFLGVKVLGLALEVSAASGFASGSLSGT